ncbi:TPA: helix-turn-helix domain-containing protein [Raoultella ornithinolytica]
MTYASVLTASNISDSLSVIRSILETATHLLSGSNKETELSADLSILALNKIILLEKESVVVSDNINKRLTIAPSVTISNRIQLARENLGLSEADFARKLNTYSDHISDWECGITEPPASMIIPLANALKCDPLWLLTGNGLAVAK